MPNNVKITVLKVPTEGEILAEDYPAEIKKSIFTGRCPVTEGREFSVDGDYCLMPEDFCQQAWRVIFPVVTALASGGSPFPNEPALQNILSCPRGIKPTVYRIERE